MISVLSNVQGQRSRVWVVPGSCTKLRLCSSLLGIQFCTYIYYLQEQVRKTFSRNFSCRLFRTILCLESERCFIKRFFRHLHASINFLLAILALCDFCYKLNDIPSFVVITSGRNFIPLLTCFYCQVIPLYGLLGVFLFTPIIALDRTILLLFPLRWAIFGSFT